MLRIGLVVVLAASSQVVASAAPQQTVSAARPDFSGTWEPADPKRTSVFFDNGMSWVPGNGKVIIDHRPTRLTVTMQIPDEMLDRLMAIHPAWHVGVVYGIREFRGRGGFGAAGDLTSPWQGDRLKLSETQAGLRLITVWLSRDGERLKKETHTRIEGKESTVPEWFVKAK